MPANLGNIFMINQCQWWRLYTEAADCRFYFTENAKPDRELAPKQCSPVAVNGHSKWQALHQIRQVAALAMQQSYIYYTEITLSCKKNVIDLTEKKSTTS